MNSPPRLENLQCRQPRLKWGKKRNLQSLVIKLARSSYVQLHPLPPENGNQYFVACGKTTVIRRMVAKDAELFSSVNKVL